MTPLFLVSLASIAGYGVFNARKTAKLFSAVANELNLGKGAGTIRSSIGIDERLRRQSKPDSAGAPAMPGQFRTARS